MAAPKGSTLAAAIETPITIKVYVNDAVRKLKLPLSDVTPSVFADKLRDLLQVPSGKSLALERYSDSSASYVLLTTSNPSSYKQLYRAAKAKTKLRLKATISDAVAPSEPQAELQPKGPSADTAPSTCPPLIEMSKAMGKMSLNKAPATSSSDFNQMWHVCCNNCDQAMLDSHYHCGTCHSGDYDLCETCVSSGFSCPGPNHWLIKRVIKNGKVINSTTERLTPKPKVQSEAETAASKPIPGSFSSESKAPSADPEEAKRTCNTCVRALPESAMVTCKDCEDFDLCISCTKDAKHGHHPGHMFEAITAAELPAQILALCAPGRAEHHWATCDGCDERILGIRHKCLDCPDWDFCVKCYDGASQAHPGHRFVPVYEKMNWSLPKKVRHIGIYCDGPLCCNSKNQCYVQGVRYKCAICHDTDFCANCEAHPNNKHNKTHPMIVFKSPVKNASISTVGETGSGRAMVPMGDRQKTTRSLPLTRPREGASETFLRAGPPAPPAYASTAPAGPPPYASSVSRSSIPQAVQMAEPAAHVPGAELDAHFVRDSITDGSKFISNQIFCQTWTLRNPGPHTWPAGVTVRTTGGDNMLNIDPSRSAGAAELSAAQESLPTVGAVHPGKEWQFTVTLRSPLRSGKHISYWRAKAPDGTPFGHKLWCEIEVPGPRTMASTSAALAQELQRLKEASEAKTKELRHEFMHRVMQQRVESERAKSQTAAALAAAQASFNKPQQIPVISQVSASHEGTIPVLRASSRENMMKRQQQMQQAQLKEFDETVKKLEAQNGTIRSMLEKVEASVAATLEKSVTSPAAEAEASSSTTSSQMVFPTLDKESPASSMQLDRKEPATEIIASAPAEVRSAAGTDSVGDELVHDFDSVEFEDDSDEDEGFLTDEEYDILDASDEEVVNNGVPAAK